MPAPSSSCRHFLPTRRTTIQYDVPFSRIPALPKPSRMHILIVEDNTLVASGIQAGLELHGFASDTAASVAQAEGPSGGAQLRRLRSLTWPAGRRRHAAAAVARVERQQRETPETQGAAIAQACAWRRCRRTGAHALVSWCKRPPTGRLAAHCHRPADLRRHQPAGQRATTGAARR